MITKIRGTLTRLLEDEARVEIGQLEYQVLIPDLVRRTLQTQLHQEISLHTIEFLDGSVQAGGKLTPRLVGFLSEPEIEFFEMFCTVDGIGVRKALRAMVRPIRDVADMIQRQDLTALALLPGISSSLAERIVAKLRKKVVIFALMAPREVPTSDEVAPNLVQEAYLSLLSVGHQEADARAMLDQVMKKGVKFKNVQEILLAVYQKS